MSRKLEIERKFLVETERLPELPAGTRMVQGYLCFQPTVRVRTEEDPDGTRRGWLTIKGEGLFGRDEYEYGIPYEEAAALQELVQASLVAKTRHRLPVPGAPELAWEVDRFEGENEGLVVAEIELPSEGHRFERPEWVGRDVTADPAYKNASLARQPFRRW